MYKCRLCFLATRCNKFYYRIGLCKYQANWKHPCLPKWTLKEKDKIDVTRFWQLIKITVQFLKDKFRSQCLALFWFFNNSIWERREIFLPSFRSSDGTEVKVFPVKAGNLSLHPTMPCVHQVLGDLSQTFASLLGRVWIWSTKGIGTLASWMGFSSSNRRIFCATMPHLIHDVILMRECKHGQEV